MRKAPGWSAMTFFCCGVITTLSILQPLRLPTLPNSSCSNTLSGAGSESLVKDKNRPDKSFDENLDTATFHINETLTELRNLLGCTNDPDCLALAKKLHGKQMSDIQALQREASATRLKEKENMDTFRQMLHEPRLPSFETMDPRFAPTNMTAFPNINIVGNQKAGSSHLYRILNSHVNVTPYQGLGKEKCGNDMLVTGSQEPVHKWFSRVAPQNKTTVYACMQYPVYERIVDYNGGKPPPGTKYVVTFRDPADLIWATFNYWTIAGFDSIKASNRWLVVGKHYRSPQLFHEILLAGDLLHAWRSLDRFSDHMKMALKLINLVGRENILFVRSEDMAPAVANNPGGFMDRLSEFTGLDRSGFSSIVVSQVTNCNKNKGASAVCKQEKSSTYRISGNRDMRDVSRRLLYLRYANHCKAAAELLEIHYPECSNSVANFLALD